MALAKPLVIDDPLPLRAQVDDPLQPRRAPVAQPVSAEAERLTDAGSRQARTSAVSDQQGDQGVYGGSPKVAVSMRAPKVLWDDLGALSRRLEDEGMHPKTSRTELTEAMWHFHMPQSTAEARDLVRRYRSERGARS